MASPSISSKLFTLAALSFISLYTSSVKESKSCSLTKALSVPVSISLLCVSTISILSALLASTLSIFLSSRTMTSLSVSSKSLTLTVLSFLSLYDSSFKESRSSSLTKALSVLVSISLLSVSTIFSLLAISIDDLSLFASFKSALLTGFSEYF